MGTPAFALPSLRALLPAHSVAAVITQPDRPQGRGKQVSQSPVKQAALQAGVPVYTFEKLRSPEGLETLKALKPDIMVTCAYGQILSEAVLAVPPQGTVNVHASLLPAYRGAAPIQWAVYNGESVTGITTMLTERGVDTGPLLLSRPVAILPGETAGELSARLSEVGAEVLLETLEGLQKGTVTPKPQEESKATYFGMLKKEQAALDFSRPALALCNQVRAFNPWPLAHCGFRGDKLKVYRALVGEPGLPAPTGTLPEGTLQVACGPGGRERLLLTEVQAPGGKVMGAADFARGRRPLAGEALR